MNSMKILIVGMLALGLFMFSGCSSKHSLVLNENYTPKQDVKIEVESVANKTSQTFEIDIQKMLKESLNKKLKADGILWANNENSKLQLKIDIIEYSEGNAFKRWIMPGWGATILTIEATLKDSSLVVGKANATRNIAAGGGFTIGAWKTVFDDIAADVIADLKEAYKKKNIALAKAR
ncbi:MAG: DUF4410 domain-containing protein [Sulfurimonas sp.]|uniref:DUF4410 domain-containing protein n=1 Tax=Sulfurimonas sp. TaxID=2022749 RepID=UPI0028CD8264|nr:DUF4410 domain-containing protein [Sulfurimonas sp.]MDT8338828.1 DUF4410 domain-containing protein [Sulfurimonas sp.]